MLGLEYGSSPLKAWVRRAEYALGFLAGLLQNWKRIVLALLLVTIVLAASLVLLAMWLDRPRKIAEVPGALPGTPPYELWYGNHGNLSLGRLGGPSITRADYYGNLEVTQTHWPTRDRVVLTMADGTKLEIAIGFTITPSTRAVSP